MLQLSRSETRKVCFEFRIRHRAAVVHFPFPESARPPFANAAVIWKTLAARKQFLHAFSSSRTPTKRPEQIGPFGGLAS